MKSTPEEIYKAHILVQETQAEIAELIARGKRVHIGWDFDGVLSTPLNEDVFSLTQFDLKRFFEYQARLSTSPPKPGIWLPLAKQVGELQASQDIVTAQSSFMMFRIMLFCMWHCGNDLSSWVRWILGVGHQAKLGSFRIILESFKNDPETVIYCIDDNAKHVIAFLDASQELGMIERTKGIISPTIRDYTREQLNLHYKSVMGAEGDNPVLVPGTPGGYVNGFLTLPDGLNGFRKVVADAFRQAEQTSVIKQFGPILESTFRDLFPDEPVTPGGLHYALRILQGEAAHDTAMINEIGETIAYMERLKEGK